MKCRCRLRVGDPLAALVEGAGRTASVYWGTNIVGRTVSWNALVGRLGEPVKGGEYVVVEDRGLTWFLEKRVYDRVPEEGEELEIHVGEYGTWKLGIEPLPEGERGDPVVRRFPPADPYIRAYREQEGEPE
jgi:hypothetical protein